MPRYLHLILDRDGVLNVDGTPEEPITVERWRWEGGSREALALLTQAGIRISVATNQSCIGRGVISAQAVEAVHALLLSECARAGALVSTIHVCPHAPDDGCSCRKPAPGLIREAIQVSGIAPARTLVVGDALRDL